MTGLPAHADDFATIPAGDALYSHLATISRAGWATTTSGPNHSLTRYEVALETAKAIHAVTAQERATPGRLAITQGPALRSLRNLASLLRHELKKLNIDANASLAHIDSVLKAASDKPSSAPHLQPLPRVDAALIQPREPTRAGLTSGLTSGLRRDRPGHVRADALLTAVRAGHATTNTQTVQLPLSQRLRVDCAVSALAREADDPFRDATLGARLASGGNIEPARSGQVSALRAVATGAAIDVTHWLTFSAGYRRDLVPAQTQSLQDSLFAGVSEVRSVKGGLAIDVGPSMTLTGTVARLATGRDEAARATRIGGGLRLSAWQNRLFLNANLSRLVPEDSFALSSKAAELNVGLDVTQSLSLSLLYQQLFGAENQTPVDRRVGGGISIKF